MGVASSSLGQHQFGTRGRNPWKSSSFEDVGSLPKSIDDHFQGRASILRREVRGAAAGREPPGERHRGLRHHEAAADSLTRRKSAEIVRRRNA